MAQMGYDSCGDAIDHGINMGKITYDEFEKLSDDFKNSVPLSDIKLLEARRACLKYMKMFQNNLKNCGQDKKFESEFILEVLTGVKLRIEDRLKNLKK